MACERDFLRAYIPVIIATSAFFMSLLGNIYCETIAFEASDAEQPTLTFGVWYYKLWEVVQVQPGNRLAMQANCVSYPSGTNFDAKWNTAKAFSIITPIFGGIMLFWSWFAPCWYSGQTFWRRAAMTFVVMTLFQGLTLLLLSSNACKSNGLVTQLVEEQSVLYSDQCVFGWGTKLNIASVVMWFVAGVLMLTVIPPPTRPDHGPPETQTVTYTKTEQPDGTQVVTETTVKGKYIPTDKKDEGAPSPVNPEEEP